MTIDTLYKSAHETWVPQWFDAFYDTKNGGFHERLDAARTPMDLPRRLVGQCRQIMVYATHGDPHFAPAIDRGFEYIEKHFALGDGAYAFAQNDRHVDLYALAFFISACAATGRTAQAAKTLDFIETHMALPVGFAEKHNVPSPKRRQNPHMHLLEAVQSMAQISDSQRWHDSAQMGLGLFMGHFFKNGVIYEFFDENLQNPDDWIEAGHHAEWVWLLNRFPRELGVSHGKIPMLKHQLYDQAKKGWDTKNGGIYNVQSTSGTPLDSGKRIWPQMEMLRAARIMGDIQTEESLLALLQKYLPQNDFWIESWDENFITPQTYCPATTPYHIYPVLKSIHGASRA